MKSLPKRLSECRKGSVRGTNIRIKRKRHKSGRSIKRVNLRLLKIERGNQEGNNLYKELINKHHYLGMAKHGAGEMRYIIYEGQEWVAAISFGFSAWACKDRDSWIGWDEDTRRKNLQKIVTNNRFLLNPNKSGGNLASQVLKLVSKHIKADWADRYGKDIVMLETFVDEKFDGGCYKAANWIEVGKTQGRGKWDQAHNDKKAIKKIFLYPLESTAYTQLGGKLNWAKKSWAEEEFETFSPKDLRLNNRLATIATDFYANPTANIPQSCGSRAKTKAAYRFFSHKNVSMNTMLEAHYQSTHKRLAKQDVVLAVQDSSSFNYATHNNPNLGTLGTSKSKDGIMVHDTMAFTEDGVPLGLLDVQTWERDPADYGKKNKRAQTPIQEKESYKWLKSYKALIPLQKKLKKTTFVSVGDREADVFELFELANKTTEAPQLLVRARHDRRLTSEETKLWDSLESEPVAGTLTIEAPRKPGQKKRVTDLSISYRPITIKNKNKKTLCLWAVYARETKPPPGTKAISWMLLTTMPVTSLSESIEKISWYMIRWQIEVYHKVIKSGCRVEGRQLENLEPLKACIAVDMVVAWKIFYMTKQSRLDDSLPCTVCFEDHEWKALYCYLNNRKNPKPIPTTAPPLQEVVRKIAMLGGFLARKSDGDPGPITIWRGLITLDVIAQSFLIFRPN